jgi:hypothetical protein
MMSTPARRYSTWITVSAAALPVVALLALAPSRTHATPAYARRYDTECTTCHSPYPPRLNNVGMVFRRSGFRLPDSDEKGNLSLKVVPAHTVGEAMAIAGQMDLNILQSQDAAAQGVSKSSAELSEVELIAGTSAGDHYSTQMLFVPYNDAGVSELENFEAQGNWGKPNSQLIARAGLAQTLIWQKAGHGSMTQSLPLILDETSPAPIGHFAGPGLGSMLPLFEVGWMGTRLNQGKMMSTMASVALSNGFQMDGSSARTHWGDGSDVLAQVTELIGSRNTANVYYYNGHTAMDTTNNVPGTVRDQFNRYGVTGSYAPIDRLDLAAGFAGGQDKSDELGKTVKTTGYYLEATGQLIPYWIATYRYDSYDPDTDTSKDTITGNTFGTSYLLEKTVFLTAEYRQLEQNSVKSHTILGRIRFVY